MLLFHLGSHVTDHAQLKGTLKGDTEERQYTPKKCKATGCDKIVQCDLAFEVVFDYCSPECRDKDLLAIHHSQLKSDIEQLENDIRMLPPLSPGNLDGTMYLYV